MVERLQEIATAATSDVDMEQSTAGSSTCLGPALGIKRPHQGRIAHPEGGLTIYGDTLSI